MSKYLAILTVACGLAAASACGSTDITTLQTTDTKAGTGTEAVAGTEVTVHYTGWLYDAGAEGQRGTKFDSSRDRGEPFTFQLGSGQVIRGWDEGFMNMQLGESARLTMTGDYANGAKGFPAWKIPPNATLVFDVEIIRIE
jgi:FKBP-type peptidyl-prolyl cis-trans isomerase